MTWLILGHRLILNQSQPLTGHSSFHIEMERIRIPPYATFMLNTNDKFKLNSLENIVKDAVDLAPFFD